MRSDLTYHKIKYSNEVIFTDYLKNDLHVDSNRIKKNHKGLTNFKIIKLGLETEICLINCSGNAPSIYYSEVDSLSFEEHRNKKIIVKYKTEDTDGYFVKDGRIGQMNYEDLDKLKFYFDAVLNREWEVSCNEKLKNLSQYYPNYRSESPHLFFTRTLKLTKQKATFIDSYGSYPCDSSYLENVKNYTNSLFENDSQILYLNVDFARISLNPIPIPPVEETSNQDIIN